MRAHYLQHVPFEGLGRIEPWLRAAGYEITCTRFHESMRLPDPAEVHLLVVLGGPMSVNDQDTFPWIVQEMEFIRSVIDAGRSVLGVCLGAQLIASSMGARVHRNQVKEIGWFPVQRVSPIPSSVFCFPSSVEVFHWHGETFELPPGAVLLARSEGCENQAFQLGRSVIGLQFHLETTRESALTLISHCRAELEPSTYVQSEAAIIGAPPGKYRVINELLEDVLSFLQARD